MVGSWGKCVEVTYPPKLPPKRDEDELLPFSCEMFVFLFFPLSPAWIAQDLLSTQKV